ncbi:MAG: heparinase II/III family protein [Gemmatimonadaceae bacterium]|nr:heparinase II/III family protein [Gloeobacterales cyanobacterium ES-bin-141]
MDEDFRPGPERERMASYKSKLGLPEPAQIYLPRAALSGSHPRFMFPGLPLSQLKQRVRDPAYANYARDLFAQATRFAGTAPPESVDLDREDPLRGYGNQLPWMALAYLVEDNPARKKIYLAGAVNWMDAMSTWGLPKQDLALSHWMLGLGTAYDWLYDALPADTKTRTRRHLIAMARYLRSPANTSARQWRAQQFLANHNWFNYAALALSAAVLWGDTGSPLALNEQKTWMDEAMQDFWLVRKTMGTDGAPVEGYFYYSYGAQAYSTFATIAGQLTESSVPFDEGDAIERQSTRLYALLPGDAGFFAYGDSYARSYLGSHFYRRIASRFRDDKAQLLAAVMESNVKRSADLKPGSERRDWRNLFWYDATVPEAKRSDLELGYDWPDLGIYSVRSSWTDSNPNFLGFKCGPAAGKTATALWGTKLISGHTHPDAGNFVFYRGPQAVIPEAGYARSKLTSNHNLIVVEGRGTQGGQHVGQLGEGARWFSSDIQKSRPQATLLATEKTPSHTSYLCDLGGLYLLKDERYTGGQYFTRYRRSLTYLPSGALVLVDQIETPLPRTFHFRLLTAARDLSNIGRQFNFTLEGVPAHVVDFSTQTWSRTTAPEMLPVYGNPERDAFRNVVTLTAPNQTRAIFAVVLGVNGSEKGIVVEADEREITIRDSAGKTIRPEWSPVPLKEKYGSL